MPTIRWGAETGADVCVPFNGNVSLSGARIVNAGAADDDVALDWSPVGATGAYAYYQCNEGSWANPGDVLDSSGNARHASPHGGATTAAGALNRYGDVYGAKYGLTPSLTWGDAASTVEFWVLPNAASSVGDVIVGAQSSNIIVAKTAAATYQYRTHRINSGSQTFTVTEGVWQHWCFMQSGKGSAGGIQTVHVNGVLQGAGVTCANYTALDSAMGIGASHWGTNLSECFIDDLKISMSLQHSQTANFTPPVWLKSALQNGGVQPYVQVTGSGLAGTLPTAVSWTAQTGSAYGRIHSVWVNDVVGGWTQVGGSYPTSPVSIAGLTLASNDAVRIALEPESASGIQNASPTLYWAQLDYTTASTRLRRFNPRGPLNGLNPGVM